MAFQRACQQATKKPPEAQKTKPACGFAHIAVLAANASSSENIRNLTGWIRIIGCLHANDEPPIAQPPQTAG
jgi:hypothetical protein